MLPASEGADEALPNSKVLSTFIRLVTFNVGLLRRDRTSLPNRHRDMPPQGQHRDPGRSSRDRERGQQEERQACVRSESRDG